MAKQILCKDPNQSSGAGTILGIAIFVAYAIGFPTFWKTYYPLLINETRKREWSDEFTYGVLAVIETYTV